MNFKKKLKIRLFVAISYLILGIAIIVVFNVIKTENSFFSSFGFALAIIGIARIRNYFLIMVMISRNTRVSTQNL
jgi:hypothetical protein